MSDISTITLKEWQPLTDRSGGTRVLVIGRASSGKTTVADKLNGKGYKCIETIRFRGTEDPKHGQFDFIVLTGVQTARNVEDLWARYGYLFPKGFSSNVLWEGVRQSEDSRVCIVMDVSLKCRQGLCDASLYWYKAVGVILGDPDQLTEQPFQVSEWKPSADSLAGKMILVIGSAKTGKTTVCALVVDSAGVVREYTSQKPSTLPLPISSSYVQCFEAQNFLQVPPAHRNHFDIVILTGRHTPKNIERVWDQYGHLFTPLLTKDEFRKAVDDNTRSWRRAVLDVSLPCRQGVRYASFHWYKPYQDDDAEEDMNPLEISSGDQGMCVSK